MNNPAFAAQLGPSAVVSGEHARASAVGTSATVRLVMSAEGPRVSREPSGSAHSALFDLKGHLIGYSAQSSSIDHNQ
jgi:hypothetical protein